MTIAPSDSRAVSSHTSELTSNSLLRSGPNDPQAITEAGLPSAFELLLSQLMGSTLHATTIVPDKPADFTAGNAETLKSNDLRSHRLKPMSETSADGSGANPLANFATLTSLPVSQPVVDVTPSMAAVISSGTDKSGDADGSTSVPSSSSSVRANESNSLVTSDGQVVHPSVATKGDKPLETEQPSIDPATASGETTAIEARDDQITHAPAEVSTQSSPQAGLPEALNVREKRFESVIPIRDFSQSAFDTELKSRYAVIDASAESSSDRLQGKNETAAVESIHMTRPPEDPKTEQADDSLVPSDTAIPVLNPVHLASSEPGVSMTDQLTTAITQNLGHEPSEGPTSVRIRLDRPDLGPVHLHLSITNNVVSIRIVTHDQLSQQIVESQINDLRQSLNNNGVECGQFQVGCDSNSRQFSGRQDSSPPIIGVSNASNSRWTTTPTSKFPAARPSGLVNFVA